MKRLMLWNLPLDAFGMHVLPHLSLLDLESLAQSAPRIMRYTSACLQRAEKCALQPAPVLTAIGALVLWKSHEQIGAFPTRYFQATLRSLIARFDYLATRRICIADLLLHIAATVCWTCLNPEKSRKPSMSTWFDILWPVAKAVPVRSAAILLFSILDTAQQQHIPVTATDAVAMIRLYSNSMDRCLHATMELASLFLVCGMQPRNERPSTVMKRRRAITLLNIDILNPAQLLSSLSALWGPSTTAILLQKMSSSEGSAVVHRLTARVYQFAGFELVASILHSFEVVDATHIIHLIRAMNQLGPGAVATFVHTLTDLWPLEKRKQLVNLVGRHYHSATRESFNDVIFRLEQKGRNGRGRQ